jgi:hypothetical protein
MPSRKRDIVEALLYASILTLIVSRRLLALVRKALAGLADRIPAQRWAALLGSASTELLLIVTRPPRELKALLQRLNATFLHEAVDPNVRRPGLLSAVETRTHAYRRR